MPLSHNIILVFITAGFSALPLALFYGWIATKGWRQTAPVALKAQPETQPIHRLVLPKAA